MTAGAALSHLIECVVQVAQAIAAIWWKWVKDALEPAVCGKHDFIGTPVCCDESGNCPPEVVQPSADDGEHVVKQLVIFGDDIPGEKVNRCIFVTAQQV